MTREGGGEGQDQDQDPKHISESLHELLFDHLEPGVPVEPSPNRFVGEEHREDRRNAKLAEGNVDITHEVTDPSAESLVTVEQLDAQDRIRLRRIRLSGATLTDPALVALAPKLKNSLNDPDQIARIEATAWRNLSPVKYDRRDFNEAVNIILERLRADQEPQELDSE